MLASSQPWTRFRYIRCFHCWGPHLACLGSSGQVNLDHKPLLAYLGPLRQVQLDSVGYLLACLGLLGHADPGRDEPLLGFDYLVRTTFMF